MIFPRTLYSKLKKRKADLTAQEAQGTVKVISWKNGWNLAEVKGKKEEKDLWESRRWRWKGHKVEEIVAGASGHNSKAQKWGGEVTEKPRQ